MAEDNVETFSEMEDDMAMDGTQICDICKEECWKTMLGPCWLLEHGGGAQQGRAALAQGDQLQGAEDRGDDDPEPEGINRPPLRASPLRSS